MTSYEGHKNMRRLHPEQFEMFGPHWQSSCQWGHWIGDCWDSPAESEDADDHECFVLVSVGRVDR